MVLSRLAALEVRLGATPVVSPGMKWTFLARHVMRRFRYVSCHSSPIVIYQRHSPHPTLPAPVQNPSHKADSPIFSQCLCRVPASPAWENAAMQGREYTYLD